MKRISILGLCIAGVVFNPCFLYSLDFLRAVELNNVAEVRRMVDEGADVNMKDSMGYTALHIASWNGHTELVEYLLQLGANPNVISPSGNTPLKFASPSIKSLLVRYGAYEAKAPPTAIFIERQAPSPMISPSLSAPSARPIVRVVSNFISNIISNTTIISNIEYPRASYMLLNKLRSEESILLHRWDAEGNNALHQAAERGDFNEVTNLVARGINPLGRNNAGDTPLRLAVEGGHLQMVKYFVETIGIDVNSRNVAGTSPLVIAAMNRKPEVLKYMIQMGGNVNSAATVIATRTSSAGGAPTVATVEGWTPLMAAAQVGDTEAMRTLLDARAGLNTRDKDGYNALMYAAQSGNLDAVRFLIDQGINIHNISTGGTTALSIAIDQKSTDIADYLRGLGAPDTKNPRYDVNTTVVPNKALPEEGAMDEGADLGWEDYPEDYEDLP